MRRGSGWYQADPSRAVRLPVGWLLDEELHDGGCLPVYKFRIRLFANDSERGRRPAAPDPDLNNRDGYLVQARDLGAAFKLWYHDLDVELARGHLDGRPSLEHVKAQMQWLRRFARRPDGRPDEDADMTDFSPLLSLRQHLRRTAGASADPRAHMHPSVAELTCSHLPDDAPPLPALSACPSAAPVWLGAALRMGQAQSVLHTGASGLVTLRLVARMPGFADAGPGDVTPASEVTVCLPSGRAGGGGALMLGCTLAVRHVDIVRHDWCSASVLCRGDTAAVRCEALALGVATQQVVRGRRDMFDACSEFVHVDGPVPLAMPVEGWVGASVEARACCTPALDEPRWLSIAPRQQVEQSSLNADGSVVYWCQMSVRVV